MPDISDLDRYREQYAHFRSMNDILYKIPPLFTAIIGGLKWTPSAGPREGLSWLESRPAPSLLLSSHHS